MSASADGSGEQEDTRAADASPKGRSKNCSKNVCSIAFKLAKLTFSPTTISLDLVKHGGMRHIQIDAVNAPRRDHRQQRDLRTHGAYLHRLGVSAQQPAIRKIKGVRAWRAPDDSWGMASASKL